VDDDKIELKDSISRKVSVKHSISRAVAMVLEAVGGLILLAIVALIILL